VLFALVAVPYLGYGLKRFGLGFWTSPRFVRNPPRTGLWGPMRFLSRETWTDEGLRERDRMFVWQAGCLVLAAVGLVLFA
jgi:hypothetical protein